MACASVHSQTPIRGADVCGVNYLDLKIYMCVKEIAPSIKWCIRSFLAELSKGHKNDLVFGFLGFRGLGVFLHYGLEIRALERLL